MPLAGASPGMEHDYDPEARIAELLARRMPAYAKAHHTVDIDALTPEDVAARIGGMCGIPSGDWPC